MARVGKCCCGNGLCCPTCTGDQIPSTWSFTYDGHTYNLRLREFDQFRADDDDEFRCEWHQNFGYRDVSGCTVNAVTLHTVNRTDGAAWRLAFYDTAAPSFFSPMWQELVGPINPGVYTPVPVDCSSSVTLTEKSANWCGTVPTDSITVTPSGFSTLAGNCLGSATCNVCCADGTIPSQFLLEIPPGALANYGTPPFCQECTSINGSFVLDYVHNCLWERSIGPYCEYDRIELVPYPLGNGECVMMVSFRKAGTIFFPLIVTSNPIESYDEDSNRILSCSSISDLPIDNLTQAGECNFIGPLYLSAL